MSSIITKDNSKSNTKSKIIALGFLLLVMVGVFVPNMKVLAQVPDPNEQGTCSPPQGRPYNTTRANCVQGGFTPSNQVTPPTTTPLQNAQAQLATDQAALVTYQLAHPDATSNEADPNYDPKIKALNDKITQDQTTVDSLQPASTDSKEPTTLTCFSFPTLHLDACFYNILFYLLFPLPAFLLYISGQLFNFLIWISITNTAQGISSFVSNAWVVVRDLSNIFFILILLYVAIQTILGLSHETKKMVRNVIIMALLINFSLFFTKVVVDSSNILALVFYNKLTVHQRPYDRSDPGEKDIGGEIFSRFNPLTLVNNTNLDTDLKNNNGAVATIFIKIGILMIGAVIMLAATWVFLVAGFLFLGRMIELWILMIFSPFAFMSFTLPGLKGYEYVGWDAWLKKLIDTAFMAPIFMFFIYLIFKLMDSGLYDSFNKANGGFWATVIGILVPAAIIIAMLKKSIDLAQKGAGQFGAVAGALVKIAAGLAVSAAMGGTMAIAAKGFQATAGRLGQRIVEKGTGKDWAENTGTGVGAWMKRKAGRATQSLGNKAFDNSWDIRRGAVGATLGAVEKATGLNIGSNKLFKTEEGGRRADLERRKEKEKKRAEEFKEVGEQEQPKIDLKNAEAEIYNVSLKIGHKLEEIVEKLKKKREKLEGITTSRKILQDKKKNNPNLFDSSDEEQLKALVIEESTINNEMLDLKREKQKLDNGTGEIEVEQRDEKGKIVKGADGKPIMVKSYSTNNGHITETEVTRANEYKARVEEDLKNAEEMLKQATTDATRQDAKIKVDALKIQAMVVGKKANDANEAMEKAKRTDGTIDWGKSKDQLEKDKEHAESEIHELEQRRTEAVATNIERNWWPPFRKQENARIAHSIRIREARKKQHKEHGGGFLKGVAEAYGGELLAKVTGLDGGGEHKKDDHPTSGSGEDHAHGH